MTVRVLFHSYFRDLTGTPEVTEGIEPGTTLGQLQERMEARFPRLGAMRNSTLLAVGVDYQPREHVLRDGDEVSLFPPVQGG
ncbi:MAG: hypothetical protein RJA22_2375 [Verrucomicrobiota bacterium]|jgi:molybdopterin converting factor small subunit